MTTDEIAEQIRALVIATEDSHRSIRRPCNASPCPCPPILEVPAR